MNKNIIKSFITISIIAALFVSCSGVNSRPADVTQKDSFTITGSFSAPDASTSRSAVSSFSLDGEFELLAYQGEETPVNGTVDTAASTWSVTLNKTGEWNIVINYKRENVLVLSGSKKITLESLTSESMTSDCVIKLGAANAQNPLGFINLEIEDQTTTVAAVSYVLSGSNLSESISSDLAFVDNKATIKIASVKEGLYELEMYFTKSTGELLYYCKEQIPVYCGYTTDTWYGESPYFVTAQEKTSLVITSNLLAGFTAPKLLPSGKSPVVLYDFNYLDRDLTYFYEEFENHVTGMSVFESVTAHQKLEDGLPVAKGKCLRDFAIDDVTKAIYTLEFDPDPTKNLYYRVVSYPTYAGYEYGKTLYSQSEKEVFSISAYDGYVYIIDSMDDFKRISSDGTVETFYIYDEDVENRLSCGYNFNIFAVYGDYVYSVRTETDSSVLADLSDELGYAINYLFLFEKFVFVEDGESGEDYLQRVKSEKFGFSITDLPCDIPTDELCYYSSSPKINDIQIVPDSTDKQKINIYALFSVEKVERGYGGEEDVCVCYGGLLKVSTENDSSTNFTIQPFDMNGTKVLGWYTGSGHSDSETDTNNWFYGPRKFIAKKQDELVIVDEGEYISDSQTRNRNRVVTVNLSTFAMSAIDVDTSFDHYAATTCGFVGSYGDDRY